MDSKIRFEPLKTKILDPYDAVEKYISKARIVAFAGMAGTALPKEIPRALSEYISKTGEKISLIVFQGGSTTPEFDDHILSAIAMRILVGGSGKSLREAINTRRVAAFDVGLYEYSRWIRRGVYSRSIGRIDVAVIEASGITEDGYIIPSLSVDAAPAFVEASDKVIVEVNLSRPDLEGLHDIYLPAPGNPIPISRVTDRIGSPYIKIPQSKIAAVVLSSSEDPVPVYSGVTQTDMRIADNIIDFLSQELEKDPDLRGELTAFQPGAGPMSSALARRVKDLPISLNIWSEVISTTWIPLILEGKVKGLSASALYTLPGEAEHRKTLYDNIVDVKRNSVLRPYEITNNPEAILRFNVISIQQAIEVDIYGHANISHIRGNLYVGIGGSVDFTRPAYLTIVAMPSTTSDLRTPRIVPIASHIDIPEHDVDVLVTEQGWADLRGLPPIERAKMIIDRCSHPKFKDLLWRYLEEAMKEGGHEPVSFKAVTEFWREIESYDK